MKRKKLISSLLAILILAGVVAVPASAESRKFKVVNIGDSTSVGFGLDDFGVYAKYDYMTNRNGDSVYDFFTLNRGFLDSGSENAYPAYLARYIQETYPAYDVEFTNLGFSGIRASGIRAILDPTFTGDKTTQDILSLIETGIIPVFGLEPGLDAFRRMYRDEVRSADLITLDCCMNTFTNYFLERLNAAMAGDDTQYARYDESIFDSFASLVPNGREALRPVTDMIEKTLHGIIPENIVTRFIDTIAYVYCDFAVNFTKLVDYIRVLNPHAILLVGGTYNVFRGMTTAFGGVEIDIGTLATALLNLLDVYITSVSPNRLTYRYIDVPDDIETLREYVASVDSLWELSPDFLKRYIDDIFGCPHSALAVAICDGIRAKAAEQGLDGTRSFWPQDVVNAFEDVRAHGDGADEYNKIIVGEFEGLIENTVDALHITRLNGEASIAALSANVDASIYELKDIPFEEMTDEQKTTLFVCVMRDTTEGALAHFSYKGCEQKCEAALKALKLALPASVYGGNVIIDGAATLAKGLLNSATMTITNVLSRIRQLVLKTIDRICIC